MTCYADLIAKLEAAPEGSRELDLEITKAVGWCAKSAWYDSEGDCLQWHEHHDFGSTTAAELLSDPLHHFTTSLDAALTLVPEGLVRWSVSREITGVGSENPTDWYDAVLSDFYNEFSGQGQSNTPALALCIAALKARAAEEGEE